MPEITVLFAGLMMLFQLALGVFVSANRGKLDIAIGDGGNPRLLQHIRAHGNFSEYVPMVLIGMGLTELAGASAGTLWLGGAALVVSRVFHVLSIYKVGGIFSLSIGAGLTYLLLLVWGIYLIGAWAGLFAA